MTFSLTDLQKIVKDFRATTGPTPCGIVFRQALKEAILQKFQITESENLHLSPSSLPIFFDHQQAEDCIIFEDQDALSAYLDRQKNPERWARILIKYLPQQLNADSFSDDFKPRIPKHSYINPS
jgi:hypothetical protein